MPNSTPTRQRQPPNERPQDDAWTDDVADRVQAILREEGLDLELVVFFDAITEVLHAVGYDGAPARFFANYPAPSDSPRSRGTPMSQTDTSQPEQNRLPALPPQA